MLPASQFDGDTIAGVNVVGNTVYVHTDNLPGSLHVVDVSNRATPVRFREETGQRSSFGIVDSDRLITVWEGTSGSGFTELRTFDLDGGGPGTIQDPALQGFANSPYLFAKDIVVHGNYAFISEGQVRLQGANDIFEQNGTVLVYDISDPSTPQLIDTLFNDNGTTIDGNPNMGCDFFISGIARTGSRLLVTSTTSTGTDTSTGVGELLVVDISDPANINSDNPGTQDAVVNRLQIPGTRLLLDVVMDGQMAYVLGSSGGFNDGAADSNDLGPTGGLTLSSIDISDPSNPILNHTETFARRPQGTLNLTVLGPGWLALTSHGELTDAAQIITFDVRDPNRFSVSQQIEGIGSTQGMTTDGSFVYVTADDGLFIYEMLPEDPLTLVGQRPIAGVRGVGARNNVSYACGTNGISVIDYSDPANPSTVRTVGSGAHIGCEVNGNVLVAIRQSGAFILDVYSIQADPLNPVLLGSTPSINYTNLVSGLELTSTHAYITQFQVCFIQGSNDVFVHQGELFSIALNLDDPQNPTSASPSLDSVLFNTFGDSSFDPSDLAGCAQNGGDHNVFGVALPNPQTAYLATSSVVGGATNAGVGRVQVVDVTDPTQASVVQNVDIPGTVHAMGIGVEGNTGVVIGSTRGWVDPFTGLRDGQLTITTLDLSDPLDPRILAHQTLSRGSRTFWTNTGSLGNGLFAFSSIDFANNNANAELLLIDVSNPRNPLVVPTGVLLDTAPPNSISTDGKYLFTADSGGVAIYEIGDFPAIPITARVQVPKGTGVEVVAGSFNISPDEIISGADFDTLAWNVTLTPGDESRTLSWQSNVTNLNPGESRDITLDSTIDFGYRRSAGQLLLTPQTVFAPQILALDPAQQSVRPAETVSFVLTLNNPSALDVTYELSVAGVPADWVDLVPQVLVQAGGSESVSLTLTSDPFAEPGDIGFLVRAQSGGTTSSVEGILTLAGDPILPSVQREARGVLVQFEPLQATAGQGTSSHYMVRLYNTGSERGDFAVSLTGLPVGFAATFSTNTLSIPPGSSNFREVTLQITPPIGAVADDYSFTVVAESVTDNTLSDTVDGLLTVVDLGVDVDLTPAVGDPDSTYQLLVTNTGRVTDTFDLTLAAPVALVASLSVSELTLGPGQSQSVSIDVGSIDFAVPGSLSLVAAATSRTNTAVRDADSSSVTIQGRLGLAVSTRRDRIQLPLPVPDDATFRLQVDNLGNLEDQYIATIAATSGPITATLIDLAGEPTQVIPLFILPGLSSGLVTLNTILNQEGTGQVMVEVRSLTDSSLVASQTFTVTTVAELDFGDAPDGFVVGGVTRNYQTVASNDGARHAIASGLRLGASIDSESEGQPNASAEGDGNDDDGVVQIASLVSSSGQSNTASFLITASAAAKLDSWIDLNGNGLFDHPTESLHGGASLDVGDGATIVTFQIPSGSIAGQSFGRFRLSTRGGLTPGGLAADGEVEDYVIPILGSNVGANAIINLIVGQVDITTDASNIVVRHNSIELFRAPGSSLASGTLLGTPGDDLVSLGDLEPALTAPIPLSFLGGDGVDTLRLSESGQTLDLTDAALNKLRDLEIVDIIGASPNTLILDPASVIASTDASDTLIIIHDEDDTVEYSGIGWNVKAPLFIDGGQRHVLTNGGATVYTINTRPWTNPLLRFDVNRSGDVTALDALQIINLLGRFQAFSVPLSAPTSANDLPDRYYDVNGSLTASALDALNVINHIARVQFVTGAGGEETATAGPIFAAFSQWDMARSPYVHSRRSLEVVDREMNVTRRRASQFAVINDAVTTASFTTASDVAAVWDVDDWRDRSFDLSFADHDLVRTPTKLQAVDHLLTTMFM